MKYLEKPNLAPEEARDYAALRRWAHRFYPGTEPSRRRFRVHRRRCARSRGSEGVMPAGGLTVPAVLDQRAEQFADRVMMSIAGTPVTFAQMRDRSCAAANVLAELGVWPGETVALFTGTCPEWVYFWLGAARIGAVERSGQRASKGEFLSHALRLSQAAVVITDAERHPRLQEVSGGVDTLRSILVQGDSLTRGPGRCFDDGTGCRTRRTRRHRRVVLHIGHHRALQGGRDHVALPVPRGGHRCVGVGIRRG